MNFSPSPLQPVPFEGTLFYIKRDDLISSCYSGNKIRKLHALFDRDKPRHLVSFGGYQSNAMLSMACFAKERNIGFTYITKPVPPWVKALGEGNLYHALSKGMQLRQVIHAHYQKTVQNLRSEYPDALVIDQGAADPLARPGIARLALELLEQWKTAGVTDPAVVLPSGTGTTALYLALELPDSIPVFTVPCVGDGAYLTRQWKTLEPDARRYPVILTPPKKYHFAKPDTDLLAVWKKLPLPFDLVYAPVTWLTLLHRLDTLKPHTLTYLHTGGVLGNPTQRERYRYELGI